MLDIQKTIACEFNLTAAQVAAVVALIDEGCTIPFIARYRKEATGGVDDVTLRDLDERLTYLKNLEARKAEVIQSIDEQGKLTPDLRASIESAAVMQRVEDLYKPFKKKRVTRASKAREAGLEPLARIIERQDPQAGDPLGIAAKHLSHNPDYNTPETALQGALDIIAENIADDAENTAALRAFTKRNGAIASEACATGDAASKKSVYERYESFNESAAKIPNHRILALNRGEKEKVLKVKVDVDSRAAIDAWRSASSNGAAPFPPCLKHASPTATNV